MQTRNNFQSNILILDEFIDSGIDSLAIDGVVKILREFTKLNKSLAQSSILSNLFLPHFLVYK